MEEGRKTSEEIPVVITIIEKEGSDEVPNTQTYTDQGKLIQSYWLQKKMEMVGRGVLPEDFDKLHKAQAIEEARLLYPRKGVYKVEEGIVEFLGVI